VKLSDFATPAVDGDAQAKRPMMMTTNRRTTNFYLTQKMMKTTWAVAAGARTQFVLDLASIEGPAVIPIAPTISPMPMLCSKGRASFSEPGLYQFQPNMDFLLRKILRELRVLLMLSNRQEYRRKKLTSSSAPGLFMEF
jgi:hypothetical protein